MNSNIAVSATLLTISCLWLSSCGSDATPAAQGEESSSQQAPAHATGDAAASSIDAESMVIVETPATSAGVVEPSGKPADGALAQTAAQAGEKVTASPPPAAFAVCAACHSVESGEGHGIGPNLFGIVGARAGTRANFQYSDAMKNSQIIWDQGQLSAFIASPEAVAPGNIMPFPGEKNASKRNEIVKYLASLK